MLAVHLILILKKKKLENEKILKESQIEAKKYKSQLDNNKKEIEKAKN